MHYTILEIQKITDAQFLNNEIKDFAINEIYFDTRRGNRNSKALFLAIDGKNADGHDHIAFAYEKLETRSFLVSKAISTDDFPEANFLFCSNVILALQKLAIHYRKKFDLPIIGITGSNGKTIVKEWIFQLAEDSFNVVRSPGSYNSQIGVPLSVLKVNENHNLGIFEAGISLKGEMAKLGDIIQPDIGIITNIGAAHSAGFVSIREKLVEKLSLFKDVALIIFCQDHELITKELKERFPNKKLVSWSFIDSNTKYHFQILKTHNGQTRFRLNGTFEFTIPFQDNISISNAACAIATCIEINIPIQTIQYKSVQLSPVKMRLEIKQGKNNCLLINDAYNSDILAFSSALKILNQQQQKECNTLILSEIEESKLRPKDLISKIAELIKSNNIQRVIAIGQNLKSLKIKLTGTINSQYFDNTEKLLEKFNALDFENENILIKGARKYKLEKVFEKLSIKVHQTILEVDMEALRHNLSVFRSRLEKDTRLMVVLKANAYGSGSNEMARFLMFQKVDFMAVAYIDEGIELRKSGIQTPIMVMNPEEAGFPQMIEFKLEPEIYSIQQFYAFLPYIKNHTSYPIHIKIETGMNRLGFEEKDLTPLREFLLKNKNIRVKSIFSHLVASEDPLEDEFTKEQILRFNHAYETIQSVLDYFPLKHILNSNGIIRFPKFQYDMVRLGIGLHGLTDEPSFRDQLQKVQTLKTQVAQIKYVLSNETVGYNRKFISQKTTKIATINIGYADGLPRIAGNGNYDVQIKGKPAAIIGNICMDMCMIDVSGMNVEEGDEVIIFGPDWPIEKLAEVSKTIPYEILTRLSPRIHRIYSRE